MTKDQMSRIVALRKSGLGYGAVAREVGLSKSTVSSFCQKNGLTGEKDLIEVPVRGNTIPAKPAENKRVPAFKVTVSFADQPNEAAVAEALRILTNAR